MLRVGWLAAALVLACLVAPRPAAALPAGEVLAVKGEPSVESGGKRSLVKLGDAVQVGDTIDVPVGAKLKLRMSDGSVIAAAPGTRVTIETYTAEPRDAKLALASGLLRAVVSAARQPARFEVDTATGVAAVRSTDWFVQVQNNGTATQVGVLTGSVSLSSAATHRAVEIPARWGARVEGGRDPVPARVWSQAEFDDVIQRTNAD
jgi:hypothetical protein